MSIVENLHTKKMLVDKDQSMPYNLLDYLNINNIFMHRLHMYCLVDDSIVVYIYMSHHEEILFSLDRDIYYCNHNMLHLLSYSLVNM